MKSYMSSITEHFLDVCGKSMAGTPALGYRRQGPRARLGRKRISSAAKVKPVLQATVRRVKGRNGFYPAKQERCADLLYMWPGGLVKQAAPWQCK
jgi:hypothetical protein